MLFNRNVRDFQITQLRYYQLQLFKGKFYHCEGGDTKNITNKSDCLQANYKWIRRKYNFDNLGQVSVIHLTLFTELDTLKHYKAIV